MTSLAGLNVFISYPRGGHAHTWAERAEATLRSCGALPFRDETAIREGDPSWLERLEQGLAAAELMVCIVGHDSAACRWQKRELIHADSRRLAVVVLRVDAVSLPFAIAECQPVEAAAGPPEAALQRLAQAVAAAAPVRPVDAGSPGAAAATERAQEVAWLQDLLNGELSDREDRYVPVAGQRRRAPTLERALKGLRIDVRSMLQRFGLHSHEEATVAAPPQPFNDVLDAYLALPGQAIRRLAVLGEPGAGKSFSLERVAVHHARAALADPAAPLPVLVRLGLWTRGDETLQAFIERQMNREEQGPALGRRFATLRDARRLVLLLDGLNEIPPGQRALKAQRLREMAEDERFAAVLVSCRERDFQDDFALPFDRLTLQPLTPPQVHGFLHRLYERALGKAEGPQRAEARFWQLAGGPDVAGVWATWQKAGASLEQFWTAENVPREKPNVYGASSGDEDARWRRMRNDKRSLMALAGNPYLLTVIALLPTLPATRTALFEGFIQQLHDRERTARDRRNDASGVPAFEHWKAVLVQVAVALQSAPELTELASESKTIGAFEGAATSLPRSAWPAELTPALLQFSIDASVLQRAGDDLRFTHQLLQESLAASLLLQASTAIGPSPFTMWDARRWWQRNGWEVVAELAAEQSAGDAPRFEEFLQWLAAQQPEVAARAWVTAGAPALSAATRAAIVAAWAARLTDAALQPEPAARAAIGRALATFGLDHRPGIGLRADGLPDIDWVPIDRSKRWRYRDKLRVALPAFEMARYPVTNQQFQAFILANGYAADAPWWEGLKRRAGPATPSWTDANAPRETVDWFEATAFCRWLSAATGQRISLPTEQQWERAAGGLEGREYPWGDGYEAGHANCVETGSGIEGGTYLKQTCAVGIYPWPSSEGVHDLAGNVWEWTDSGYDEKQAARVLRGGSWSNDAGGLRAAVRIRNRPVDRDFNVGFRLCRASPI